MGLFLFHCSGSLTFSFVPFKLVKCYTHVPNPHKDCGTTYGKHVPIKQKTKGDQEMSRGGKDEKEMKVC